MRCPCLVKQELFESGLIQLLRVSSLGLKSSRTGGSRVLLNLHSPATCLLLSLTAVPKTPHFEFMWVDGEYLGRIVDLLSFIFITLRCK